MEVKEICRLVEALRIVGMSAEEILNLLMYVESGDEKYKPTPKQ